MSRKEIINVTKTTLPPLKSYVKFLEKIWGKNQITNYGPLVRQLETKLNNYLGTKNLLFVANGTVALEIAIKALGIQGEIITTPFSYVATTSSIVWVGCKPVFVDIDTSSLNINPALIEKSITNKTKAILATHVYGNPCSIEKIQKIANDHNLYLIYDAAHCFGVKYKGKSVLNYGDISTLSFHATKIFHTAEGGAIVTANKKLVHKFSYLRNFGHRGQEEFWGLGINGKNSELHAAMGLAVLPRLKNIISGRKKVTEAYDSLLNFEKLRKPVIESFVTSNYAYYPVILDSQETLLRARKKLNAEGIFPRRYFYPSLSSLNYLPKVSVPVSEDISGRVLCLPLFSTLKPSVVKKIANIINKSLTR